MSSIGTNEARKTPGAYTPTRATTAPTTAASEYAGDVEARPMTRASTKPIAPCLSCGSGEGALMERSDCPSSHGYRRLRPASQGFPVLRLGAATEAVAVVTMIT